MRELATCCIWIIIILYDYDSPAKGFFMSADFTWQGDINIGKSKWPKEVLHVGENMVLRVWSYILFKVMFACFVCVIWCVCGGACVCFCTCVCLVFSCMLLCLPKTLVINLKMEKNAVITKQSVTDVDKPTSNTNMPSCPPREKLLQGKYRAACTTVFCIFIPKQDVK